MKKGIFAILAMLTVSAMLMVSCGGGDSGSNTPGGGGTTTVKLTFIGNYTGAPDPTTKDVAKDTAIGNNVLPTLVREAASATEAYLLVGWYLNEEGTGNQVTAASKFSVDTSLYAKWETYDPSVTVTVTFDGNGNTGGTAPAAISHAGYVETTVPGPGTLVRTNFTFGGWNTEADGEGEDFVEGETLRTAEDLTLYAMWNRDITIAFNGNGNTSGTAPDAVIVPNRTEITLPAAGTLAKTGNVFDGWGTSATATEGLAAGAKYEALDDDVTFYAIWKLAYTVKFDIGDATGTAPADLVPTKEGGKVKLPGIGTITKTGFTFDGWSVDPDAASLLMYNIEYVIDANDADTNRVITLKPVWVDDATITVIEEEISLANAWNAVYKFELPVGKTWADYTGGFSVEYKISAATLLGGAPRAVRVMGQFLQVEIDNPLYGATNKKKDGSTDSTVTTPYNIAIVGNWPGGASNDWIYSHIGGSWDAGKIPDVLGPFLDEGVDIVGDTWFKVNYPPNTASNAGPNGTWNGTKVRKPADTDTGPFYFAIGLSGTGTANKQQIRNVKLTGKTAASVIGTPVYYTVSGGTDMYRALNGQQFENGWAQSTWEIKSGASDIVPIDLTPATITANQISYAGDPNYKTTGEGDVETPVAPTVVKYNKGTTLRNNEIPTVSRPGYKFDGWYKEAALTNKVVDFIQVFETDATFYAKWLKLPAATEDEVKDLATFKFTTFGGIGSLDTEAGPGPYNFLASQSSDAAIGFVLPEVDTALYSKIEISYTVKKLSSGTPANNMKLTFHQGRAPNSWSGGDAAYDDVVGEVDALVTKTQQLDPLKCSGGIVIQHNKYGSQTADFVFTITGVKLFKPVE